MTRGYRRVGEYSLVIKSRVNPSDNKLIACLLAYNAWMYSMSVRRRGIAGRIAKSVRIIYT